MSNVIDNVVIVCLYGVCIKLNMKVFVVHYSKNTKYKPETLMDAFRFIEAFEQTNICISGSDMHAFSQLNNFFNTLKEVSIKMSNPIDKQNLIEMFKILTDISFDKLEKDVMGVN